MVSDPIQLEVRELTTEYSGKHVLLFRQSVNARDRKVKEDVSTEWSALQSFAQSSLLCDRFVLVDGQLKTPLEVRYRRSRHKSIPANDKDTLDVKDMNDVSFYEPTYALTFVRDLTSGRFTILRLPTATPNTHRWHIWAPQRDHGHVRQFEVEADADGLFDLQGKTHYTCPTGAHGAVFADNPGVCTSYSTETDQRCGETLVPWGSNLQKRKFLSFGTNLCGIAIDKPSSSGKDTDKEFRMNASGSDLDLRALDEGVTLELWVKPVLPESLLTVEDDADTLLLKGTRLTLFEMSAGTGSSLVMDDNLYLALTVPDDPSALLCRSNKPLKIDAWNHVAVVFTNTISHHRSSCFVVNGSVTEIPVPCKPGILTAMGSLDSLYRLHGLLSEARLWSVALHPATIATRRTTRAIGDEPMLEACWHLDEGGSFVLYDSTQRQRHLRMRPKIDSDRWQSTLGPSQSVSGMVCRFIRAADDNVKLDGALHAALYHVSRPIKDNRSISQNPDENPKTFKREARVLICLQAAACGSSSRRYPIVLDFAIAKNGSVSVSGAAHCIPATKVIRALEGNETFRCFSLIEDPASPDTFGAALDSTPYAGQDASPFVWDSAVGSPTIYLRTVEGALRALTYTPLGSPPGALSTALCPGMNVTITSKDDSVKRIKLQISITKSSPAKELASIRIQGQLQDGSFVNELWTRLPLDRATICDIVSGRDVLSTTMVSIAILDQIQLISEKPKKKKPYKRQKLILPKLPTYSVSLQAPLTIECVAGTCIRIGTVTAQLQQSAKLGDRALLIGKPIDFGDGDTASWDPYKPNLGSGLDIYKVPHHRSLVSGDPIGSDGASSVAVLALESSDSVDSSGLSDGDETDLHFGPRPPHLDRSSTPSTLTLSICKDALSMLDSRNTVVDGTGFTFEAWIKVDWIGTDSNIICAYTCPKMELPDGETDAPMTFTLSCRPSNGADANGGYSMDMNVNGSYRRVCGADRFVTTKWNHLACSRRTASALKLDGKSHVKLGVEEELKLQDFTVLLKFHVGKLGPGSTVLLSDFSQSALAGPIHLSVTNDGKVRFNFTDVKSNESRVFIPEPDTPLVVGGSYQLWLSTETVSLQSGSTYLGLYRLISLKIWPDSDDPLISCIAPSKEEAAKQIVAGKIPAGVIRCSDASGSVRLLLGNSHKDNEGLHGSISGLCIYGKAHEPPLFPSTWPHKDLGDPLASWSFVPGKPGELRSDSGTNHGKIVGNVGWHTSPFVNDPPLVTFLNGQKVESKPIPSAERFTHTLAGPRQLTLGNANLDYHGLKFLANQTDFKGQLCEIRLWSEGRTREQVCDSMYSSLEDPGIETLLASYPVALRSDGSLRDVSLNSWHLKSLCNEKPNLVVSSAPVGDDAPCISRFSQPVSTLALTAPAVTEYGDLEVDAQGGLVGSFKRAYSYVDQSGSLVLETGFRIGSMLTEWVSQAQTDPTLIGYIEGAPPIPAENYTTRNEHHPSTSVRFTQATKCTYSYGTRREDGYNTQMNAHGGIGAKWHVEAGIGVVAAIETGHLVLSAKSMSEWAWGYNNNEVSGSTLHKAQDLRVDLSGTWVGKEDGSEQYEPANVGVALVESETVDVYALRLKVPHRPLVAYQMRPNPGIPKDRNLITFQINPFYTKQGTLDGRNGLERDADYPADTGGGVSEASYFKPLEAYALRDKIRRSEEKMASDWDNVRHRNVYTSYGKARTVPERSKRNICNSYVWTAAGGSYHESGSVMDFVQQEVGGSSNYHFMVGGGMDAENVLAGFLTAGGFDLMWNTHYTFMSTKEKTTDISFELQAEPPSALNIRHRGPGGKLVPRPGAVDAYRWMSFWLEDSTDHTAVFFNRVLDPIWLQSTDPNAKVLRELAAKQAINPTTKAWRVLHRCTYVSRVGETIPASPSDQKGGGNETLKKATYDYSANWAFLRIVEPSIRGAKDKPDLVDRLRVACDVVCPGIAAHPTSWTAAIGMVASYVGLANV